MKDDSKERENNNIEWVTKRKENGNWKMHLKKKKEEKEISNSKFQNEREWKRSTNN